MFMTSSFEAPIRKVMSRFLAISIGIGAALLFGSSDRPWLVVEPDNDTCFISSDVSNAVLKLRVSSNTDVVITHVDTNCNCILISELPLDLRKGQIIDISAKVDLSKMSLPGRIMFRFFTNPPLEAPVAMIEIKHDDSTVSVN